MSKPRVQRNDVDGWVILDKPVGMTSTHAVSRLKRLFNAKKAGHAGTLDPLASGLLPVAFGEATKTVPFVQDGMKAYRFTVRWGVETDTDDADGKPVETSDLRPAPDAIMELLPAFTGTILQTPPAYSALKIAGERAYDLARDGEVVTLAPRTVTIHSLVFVEDGGDYGIFEASCGKGTYVRALARDLGRLLGCYGHIETLRRTRVGPYGEADLRTLDTVGEDPGAALLRIETALSELPSVIVDHSNAARLRRGQSLILRGRDAPVSGPIYATCEGSVVATGLVEHGEMLPRRVFASGP